MTTENNTPADDGRTIEGAIVEVKPDNALVVLDPVRYATELFAPFHDQLSTAKRRAARAAYDVTTRDGMATAREVLRTFVKIRTAADKAKTEAKRPIDQAGKEILARYNLVKTAAETEEAKHAAAIEAEQARQAKIEADKLAAERTRIEAIENRIAQLRNLPAQMLNADSASIAATIESMSTMRLEPTHYDEHLPEALTVLNEAIDKLREHHDAALAREAEARRVAAERAELQRLREEQAAAEQRQREEAAARDRQMQAERAAAAERERAAQEALASQARELEALRAQLRASQAPAPAPSVDPVATEQAAHLVETQLHEDTQVLIDQPEGATSPVITDDTPGEPIGTIVVTQRKTIPAPARPSDLDIVQVLSHHFEVPANIALSWIITVDSEAVRAALAGA